MIVEKVILDFEVTKYIQKYIQKKCRRELNFFLLKPEYFEQTEGNHPAMPLSPSI